MQAMEVTDSERLCCENTSASADTVSSGTSTDTDKEASLRGSADKGKPGSDLPRQDRDVHASQDLEIIDPALASIVSEILEKRCPPVRRFNWGSAYAVKVRIASKRLLELWMFSPLRRLQPI